MLGWLHSAQLNKFMEREASKLRTYTTVRTHRKKLASLRVHSELKPCDPKLVGFKHCSPVSPKK